MLPHKRMLPEGIVIYDGDVFDGLSEIINDYTGLNKGGDLKKKEKNRYFLKLSQFQRRS